MTEEEENEEIFAKGLEEFGRDCKALADLHRPTFQWLHFLIGFSLGAALMAWLGTIAH